MRIPVDLGVQSVFFLNFFQVGYLPYLKAVQLKIIFLCPEKELIRAAEDIEIPIIDVIFKIAPANIVCAFC